MIPQIDINDPGAAWKLEKLLEELNWTTIIQYLPREIKNVIVDINEVLECHIWNWLSEYRQSRIRSIIKNSQGES